MTGPRALPVSGARAAVFVGWLAGFVALVDLVRVVRLPLLTDPDPSWAAARLVLSLGVAMAAGAAAAIAAGTFLLWSRSPPQERALALPSTALVVIVAVSVGAGAALRFGALSRLAIPYLEDEVNLIGPALALSGTWRDFADAIRPIPYGVPDPHETIGVLYLRVLRGSLAVFGTTPWSLRFPSAAAGALSLLTGTLLGRALLPVGGGALTALVLSGMRWHLILSLSGWQSIVLAPLVDIAALLLLVARRRASSGPAAAAGLVLGVGAHVYLSAWVAGAALGAFSFLACERRETRSERAWRTVAFTAGFLAAAAPIFLLARGRTSTYFGRAERHSVFAEMRYARSPAPLFFAAADAIVSPWFLPEPEGRHDLTDRSRLGPLVGVAVAAGLAGALLRPRREASALFLCHAGAALAAAVAGGRAGLPNGFRFGYLTTVTAVVASAGALQFAGLAGPARARAAALLAVGSFAASGALGTRDALLVWPERQATFDSFHGEDTLLGRAAARWESYGEVELAKRLGRSDMTIDTVRRYGLDAGPAADPAGRRARAFRLERPGTPPAGGERSVEQVRDAWGRDWAVVLGRAARR